ncbi:hypothetical protein [Mycobacteroides chelonae]|uniref:hypothetical protein n=1 Tax=Mycobacteroides chelonae TaxID=1774 RepID=UPI001E357E87|nr:hypothetical protein [Mycobacteroides chelonae]
MTVNPEQDVIDAIDALVDEQMAGGEVAHRDRARVVNTDRCSLCGGAWHGETWTGIDYAHLGEYDQHDHGRAVGCPGASATTGPQRIRWRWSRSRVRTGTFQMVGPGGGYTMADLMALRSRRFRSSPVVRFWDDEFNLVASTADLAETPDWVTDLMEQAIAYCQDQIQAMLGIPGASTLDQATVGELVAEIPLDDITPAAPAVYVDQIEGIRWGSDEPARVYACTWLPGDDVGPYFRPIGYVTGDGPRVIDEDGHDLGPWGFNETRAVLAIEAALTTTHIQWVVQTLRRWLGL